MTAALVINGGAVPDADWTPSPCAAHVHGEVGICVRGSDQELLRRYLARRVPETAGKHLRPEAVVNRLQEVLEVTDEAGIWSHPDFQQFAGEGRCQAVLMRDFKPTGPAHSTDLLDNFNIDETLRQWCSKSAELFGRKCYHVPYQMIDFAVTGTELAHLDLYKLHKSGYTCFAVVLNTDYSTGRGKHWFCLFGDMSGTGDREHPWRLEYFNSSGNPPASQVDYWLRETCHFLLRDHRIHCDPLFSARRRLQYSNTECGVWSLLYIKSRLDGHPPGWLYEVKADDEDMIKYRQQLFRPR